MRSEPPALVTDARGLVEIDVWVPDSVYHPIEVSAPGYATHIGTLVARRRAGLSVREAVREKEALFRDLGLGDPAITDSQLLDAMGEHPVLINRPFVVTSLGTRLCRPSELVLDIMPQPQRGHFAKEDGEVVVDAQGRRIR
jgi:arsenate reductase